MNNPSVIKPLLKISQAAQVLGVSIDTLRRWEKQGKITAIRTPGGTRLYSLESLEKINPSSTVSLQTKNLSTEELLKRNEDGLKNNTFSPVILRGRKSERLSSIDEGSLTDVRNTSNELRDSSLVTQNDKLGLFKKSLLLKFLIPSTVLAIVTLLLGFVLAQHEPPPTLDSRLSTLDSSKVLAVTSAAHFLEINADTQINNNLDVRDCINGLNLQATPSASPVAGCTSLTVSKSAIIDQDLSTNASPTFTTLNLSANSNQLVFQSGGPTGTLTWTPTAARVITLPDATTTLIGTDTTDTLTNKSISGSTNTLTNIPNSALTNAKITLNPGTNLTGGGDITLGGSGTLSLKDSITLSGTLAVSGASTLTGATIVGSTLAVTGATALSSTLAVTGATTLSSTLEVTGNSSFIGDISKIKNITYSFPGSQGTSGQLLVNDGSGNLTWTTVSGSGITADSLDFSEFKDAMTLDAATNIDLAGFNLGIYGSGNVGIGTTSPTSNLHVVGTTNITGATTLGSTLGVTGLITANGGITIPSGQNLTLSGLTQGAVPFIGASGVVSQNPAQFFWDNSNKRLGIGTSAPNDSLEILANGSASQILLTTYNNDAAGGSLVGRAGRGTPTAPAAVQANDALLFLGGRGYDGSALTTASKAYISIRASETWSTSAQGTYIDFFTTIPGTTSRNLGMILDGNGNLGIGYSAPVSDLVVSGNATIGSGATYTSASAPANGLLVQGNVGIGTTSPTAKFSVGTGATSNFKVTAAGNTTIGGTLSVVGQTTVTDKILASTGSIDIGTSATRFGIGYFDTIDATNIAGTVTGGSTTSSSWTINSDNATADTEDMSLAFERGTLTPNAVLGWDSNNDEFDLNSSLHITGTLSTTNGITLDGFTNDITTGTNEHLSLMPNGTGNVGIGTTSPTNTLTVAGNLNTTGNIGIGTSATGGYNLTVVGTTNITGATTLGSTLGVTGTITGATLNATSAIQLNGNSINTAGVLSNVAYLNQNQTLTGTNFFTGNVGIGATATGAKLNITGGNVGIGVSATGTELQINGGIAAGWGTTATTLASGTVAGFNGNVGIGTTSATSNLHLVSTLTTGTAANINANSITSGTGLSLTGNALTSGSLASFTSTSTALTSGSLLSLDWSPTVSTTSTSNLFNIGIGVSGFAGNLLNINSAGSSIFSISQTAVTTSLPLNLTAPGDVSVAYDLTFTNPTASYIKSNAPLYLQSGEIFNSSNLTLQTFNNGKIVLDGAGGTQIGVGTTAATNINGGVTIGDGYINSIAPNRGLAVQGNVGIGTTSPSAPLEVKGSGTGATIAKFTDNNTTGCLIADGGTISCSSDATLKKNISDINYGLDALRELRPVTFNWKTELNSTSKSLGFIAQELEQVIPKLVTIDLDGNRQLNSIGLIPVITKSIQELDNKLSEYAPMSVNADGTLTTSAIATNKLDVSGSTTIGTGYAGVYTAPTNGLLVQGNVGIGFSSPGSNLDIYNPTASTVDAFRIISNVSSTGNVVFRVDTTGAIFSDAGVSVGTPADVAENYETADPSLTAGDVVSIASSSESLHPTIEKSTSAYQRNVLGIISSKPGLRLAANTDGQPVALAGRVPAKVSTENGSIQVGDYLTSSSIPGVAMKATRPGQVIGKALEEFSCHPVLDTGSINIDSGSGAGMTNCYGKILVFVNVSFADPDNFLASLSLDSSGNLIAPSIRTDKLLISDNLQISSDQTSSLLAYESIPSSGQDNNNTSYGSAAVAVNVIASLKNLDTALLDVKSKQATQSSVIASQSEAISQLDSRLRGNDNVIASQSAELAETKSQTKSLAQQLLDLSAVIASTSAQNTSKVGSDSFEVEQLNLTPPDILYATGSATLANLKVTSEATFSGMLAGYDLNISNSLKSLGTTTLGKTLIAGDLSIDGTLSIENGNTINALSILYLQSSTLAKGLDIFNGKVIIDRSGNITTTGTISASEVKTNKLTISNDVIASQAKQSTNQIATDSSSPRNDNSTIGTATLPAYSTNITIQTSEATDSAKVFITPTTPTDKVLSVTNIKNGQSFNVSTITPQTTDIKFNWWIVGTE